MNAYERLKKRFADREKIAGTGISFFSEPMLIEKMKRDDLDFLVFDMEHGRFDAQDLAPHLHMCRLLEIPTIVRVQDAEYHLIAKTIDMGADGIMLPRTETVEQLSAAVDGLCFYPVGKKGFGGLAQFRRNESFEAFQGDRYLVPQIESPKGIENLPGMLDRFGDQISAVFIGPYDMSVMVGTPFDVHSGVMRSSIQKVVEICQAYQKSIGIFCGNTGEAATYLKMGINMFWVGMDLDFFIGGFNRVFDELSTI